MRRLFMLWRMMRRDIGVLRAALARSDRPAWLMPASIALALFAIDPLNFALPMVGIVDDFVLLPLLLRGLVSLAAASRPAAVTRRTDDRIVSVQ